MKLNMRRLLARRNRSIQNRLDKTKNVQECPVLSASNIQYEVAERTRAIAAGGIGAIHLMVKQLGLDTAINQRLNVFKLYLPYSESDHVLNIAYNLLAGGTCLEHLELRRNDEAYLNALDAQRIPDPTTAGDFCRRFDGWQIFQLMNVLKAWAALLLPVHGRWEKKHEGEKRALLRMDFTTFRNALINIPAQIIKTGRRIVYRILSWNRWQSAFFRLVDSFSRPLRC